VGLGSCLLTRLIPVPSALTEAELYEIYISYMRIFIAETCNPRHKSGKEDALSGCEELPSYVLVAKVVATR